ncbi:hypothetical protein [Streptomyces clavifer]|uniref:hypothetical protein n=1 Tax=Streptomyces clavifer TaxID=68188 RepID=UPI00340F26EA
MNLTASGVASAGIKAAGGPLGALIGRYPAYGYPQLGSREDWAGALSHDRGAAGPFGEASTQQADALRAPCTARW